MKYRNTIIVLGFLVVILSSLGFPQGIRDMLYVIFGAAIVILGYLSYPQSKKKTEPSVPTSTQP